MSALDRLLVFLLEGKSRIADHLRIAGYTEDEVWRRGTKRGRLGSPSQRDWGRIG
ncbi:MAG TPA: hypothetical protein VJ935_02615 [Acidimicrobiia bacterium]|nr:hypothetical protein [Acidimicrobiia bacterium]